MPPPASRTPLSDDHAVRATARQYDQHLRAVAAHFDNNGGGRANSAGYLSNFFHELVGFVRPQLFVEAGAYRADASRRVKHDHPDCRVVAFEANPHNHGKYDAELGFDALGVEYVNQAITDRVGTVTFNLRTSENGVDLRPDSGNSSLLRRSADGMTYEEIPVQSTSLDAFFPAPIGGPVCIWVDVEGASKGVLEGAEQLLSQTDVVLIEVEEHEMWEGQWRSLDVMAHLIARGFIPIARDVEYPGQYNVLFVKEQVYERPEVLLALELHLNFLIQRMGMPPLAPPVVSETGSEGGLGRRLRSLTRRDGTD